LPFKLKSRLLPDAVHDDVRDLDRKSNPGFLIFRFSIIFQLNICVFEIQVSIASLSNELFLDRIFVIGKTKLLLQFMLTEDDYRQFYFFLDVLFSAMKYYFTYKKIR
jgi:hypothetical protein